MNYDRKSVRQKGLIIENINVYNKIGYVYQRKIGGDLFGIKFIVKIPISVVSKVKPVTGLFKI